MAVTQLDAARQVKDLSVTNAKLAGSIALSKLAEAVLQADGGQALTGDLDAGGNQLTNLGAPASDNDAARLLDVNLAKQGISTKEAVRVATTGNIALTGTQTIDGVALSANDRVLVKNQTDPAENGIYVVAGGAWARADDASTTDEVDAGARVFVDQGATQANRFYTQQNTVTTFADQSWVYDGSVTDLVAGAGLTRTGDTFDVAAGTGLGFSGDDLIVTDAPLLDGQDGTYYLDRTNHTGTQTAATISDFTEAAQDAIGGALLDTATLDLVYDDVGNTVAGNVLDSPTVGGATPAQLRDRSTHTGTQAASTISDFTEAAEDVVGGMVTGNTESGISVTYDDTAGKLNFTVDAPSSRIVRETPTGAVDGANAAFALANTPAAGSEEVFLNGLLQEPGAGDDYTISGATITFASAPETGDRIRVSYVPS